MVVFANSPKSMEIMVKNAGLDFLRNIMILDLNSCQGEREWGLLRGRVGFWDYYFLSLRLKAGSFCPYNPIPESPTKLGVHE